MNRRYTTEDHRKAFEAWLATDNWQHAARTLGTGASLVLTVKAWARDDFQCHDGCPWHGWKKLRRDRENAFGEQIAPILEQKDNAVAAAIESKVALAPRKEEPLANRREVIASLIKSDLERIIDFEIIYNKALYHATGIARPLPGTVPGEEVSEEALSKMYRAHGVLKVPTFESAVRTLVEAHKQIKELMESSGLKKKHGSGMAEQAAEAAVPDIGELDIEVLRAFKHRYEQTPPEKRAALAAMLRSEEEILDANARPDPGANQPAPFGPLPRTGCLGPIPSPPED